MIKNRGMTQIFITRVAISRGLFGRRKGRPPQRVITPSWSAPLTAKGTRRNLRKIVVGSLASPASTKLSCASLRSNGAVAPTTVLPSVSVCSNLHRVLNSIDGESHYCRERLRRVDGGDLRCPR